MVLVNGLTIDDINAALIALQRGQGEVVGGVKNTTVQNISINNSGGSGGPDFTPQIIALQDKAEELDERVETLEGKQEETDESIEQLTERLNNVGVRQLVWYEPSRQLTIVNADNSQAFAIIPSETVTLNLEGNTLVFTMGVNENSDPQIVTVELPFIPTSEKGVAGGVATLDNNGRVPYSQLPESAMEYKGKWDASTNTPHLEDGVGTNGDFYVCSAPGTVTFGTGNTITFVVNDRVIYDGTDDMWEKLPAGAVSSVNGQTGDVVLDANDIDYSSTKTVKQAIDDIQPVQADWEESDSTDPSYIRNKIPIWIASGSASDNMAPVNSVTSGEMRPVTSNAVYTAIGGGAIKYKDIEIYMASMNFTQPSGRNFYYYNIPKTTYFNPTDILLSVNIIYWTGVPMIIADFDSDASSLSFRTPNLTYTPTSNARIKVRCLYLEV